MRISKDISPLFIISFLVLTHCLVVVLCVLWYRDFVVKAFDPAVVILFGMAAACTLAIDYGIFHSQILSRQMLLFCSNAEGLRTYGAFHPTTLMCWRHIAYYGTICERPGCMILFFSANTSELPNHKDYARITPNNIVIQYRPETWAEIQKGIPLDMKKDLERAIGTGRSSFFRHK